MNPGPQAVFRPEALRRYAESQESPVLPPMVCQRLFNWLWISLALLTASGLLVALTTRGILGHE